ncbi:conserved exported protein of unknown function [Pseudomonas sp. JV551A1]|uniref:Twin-arginine translocation signal domain-containing protein n=1 Tax=Pseudomonas inefficax TaxID=2078786 RepID=A0AAQ1PAC5_9PSED|nr:MULTISPECIES: twin-arginine translocation signal domain-containing protein [Pseudomonas]SPO54633.1 conserved exported protein of unknown function [Pseudomonas sp. JV551A1]SPO62087.1 conserved exported protein of unknown function [Pseudomonas inefficax]
MGLDELTISRRRFLRAGSGVAALAVLANSPWLAMASARPLPANDIRFIVTDRRHALSVAFAKAYVARGSEPLEVVDGLTRLWQQSLLPMWRRRDGAVAGLTTRAVWQCLAEQARSHSLRTRALAPVGVNDGHPDNLVSWIIA